MFSHDNSGNYSISDSCFAVLQLSQIKGLGLKNFHLLYNYFCSPKKILNASYEEIVKSGIKPKLAQFICEYLADNKHIENPYFERLLEWSDKKNNYVICLDDELYPKSLKETYAPPPILYLQGQINAFEFDSLAIVGSRRPTLAGQKNAIRFSRQLAEMGFCITSGLAIGIDTYAHKGAVDANGVSCAVLGSGLESIYPKQNQKLAFEIQEQGLLISELALDVNAMPANFPRRNRVISGLSKGVIVVEAGLKSGSLITAEFAIEQNREVFAIPGSIDNPLSRGGHALIKQGAQLVEEVSDIVGILGQQYVNQKLAYPSSQSVKADYSHLTMDEQRVISVLGSESTSFDDLVHCLAIDVGELNNLLVMLELKGEVSAVAGGYQKV